MLLTNKNLTIALIALLFFLGIISISYQSWGALMGILFLLLIICLANKDNRYITSLFFIFLISLILYKLTTIWIDTTDLSTELNVLLNRGMLIILLASVSMINLYHRKKISFFKNKAKWNTPISLPFHSIKLLYFMGIGIMLSGTVFIPFILKQDLKDIQYILLFAILFSIINATLEELLWRGIMLSNLKESTSVTYAIIVTSVGFGLSHLLVGIPFIASLSFSFAGLFYAFVVLKTNSIYPVILLHFFINMGMVLSGMII